MTEGTTALPSDAESMKNAAELQRDGPSLTVRLTTPAQPNGMPSTPVVQVPYASVRKQSNDLVTDQYLRKAGYFEGKTLLDKAFDCGHKHSSKRVICKLEKK